MLHFTSNFCHSCLNDVLVEMQSPSSSIEQIPRDYDIFWIYSLIQGLPNNLLKIILKLQFRHILQNNKYNAYIFIDSVVS